MVNVSKIANLSEQLVRQLHCVIVHNGPRRYPLRAGWQDRPATAAEIADALDNPDLLVGYVPGRSGLLVIDIDQGKTRSVEEMVDAVEDVLGSPIAKFRTRSRGQHLLYRSDQDVGNGGWEGGDLRSGRGGYAILYNGEAMLAALENLDDYQPVDTSLWPLSREQKQHRRPFRTRRASRPSRSLEKALRAALASTPCHQLSYEDWLFVGFGLHHAEACGLIPDGMTMWTDFSKTDPRRFVVGECESKWEGFDPNGGITYRVIFAIAKGFGYRPGRRRRKPKHKWGKTDDPDLNGRQAQELNLWYAQAKKQRASRKDGLLVQVNQSHAAHLMGCSRRTVIRDIAHLVALNRMSEDGQQTVTYDTGGHVEKVYRLLPVSTRHDGSVSLMPDGQQKGWETVVDTSKDQEPVGPTVTIQGRVYVVVPELITCGLTRLDPVDPRAPP